MSLSLIPQPQKLKTLSGSFIVPSICNISISDGSLYPVAENAKKLFKKCTIGIGLNKIVDTLSITINSEIKPGAYRLKIGTEGVSIKADSVSAAFYGLQTLLQISAQSTAGKLPCLSIDDWPDFQERGLYYDVCRGRMPKLERLMELADLLAHHKINQLQLYIEHTFKFRGHPDIGKGASPLTAEDILKLDAYCRERHIELVPSLASFGHLSTVLKRPQYRHLAEDWGIGKYSDPDAKISPDQKGWSLAPSNPKVYDFLDSLFLEFLPLFSSDRFNICCDETWDLGTGQSYELCKEKGKGRVYLDHIIKLNKLSQKYGKRTMFWGDVIRKYPELIKDIPSDATVLDWGYAYNTNFEAICDFKNAGLKFLACPGTSSWVSLFPRIHEATANIKGFAKAAKKNGALGLLNTDWGDGGHYNFMEYSWHGFLLGAEQSWNVKADVNTFTARFAKLFLRTTKKSTVTAIETLGDVTHLRFPGYYQSIWKHIFFASPKDKVFTLEKKSAWISQKGKLNKEELLLNAKLGRDTLKKIEKVKTELKTCASEKGTDPHGILPYWIFAVDTIAHAARKLSILGEGGDDTPTARRELKREMLSLMKRFETLWHARNRPSEIRITLNSYRKVIKKL